MTNVDGDIPPLNSFSQEPNVSLKGGGLPWPVFLAGGLAIAAVIGFFGFRSYKARESRKVYVAFAEQYADFEKKEVNAFWICLFGKDVDARQFKVPEQASDRLESSLMMDPKNFPEKVQSDCVPKALAAAKKAKNFDPVPPVEFDKAMSTYGQTLAGMANALNIWSEDAPKRVEAQQTQAKVMSIGGTWSTTGDPRKPNPEALQFHNFLTCALPGIDKIKDGQAMLEFLAGKCFGKKADPEYLTSLRDKCLPAAAAAAPAKPQANFKAVLGKMASDWEREEQALTSCFKAMNKLSKKDNREAFARAWTDAINASTEIRKIGKDLLKDE